MDLIESKPDHEVPDEPLVKFIVQYEINKKGAERLHRVAGPTALDELMVEINGAFEKCSEEVLQIQRAHEKRIQDKLKSKIIRLHG